MTQPVREIDPPNQASEQTPPIHPAPVWRRRWCQYTLRALLCLTALVAVLLALALWHLAPYRAQKNTMTLIERLGGSFQTQPAQDWAERLTGSTQNVVLVNLADCDDPPAYVNPIASLPRLETLIVGGQSFTDEQLRELRQLQTLRWLVLDSTSVSDDAIASLEEALPNLTIYRSQRRTLIAFSDAGGWFCDSSGWRSDFGSLGVMATPASHPELQKLIGQDYFHDASSATVYDDRQAAYLPGMITLEVFSVGSEQVTDTGIANLSMLKNLEAVHFDYAQATDGWLARLAHLEHLKELNLYDATNITDAGLRHIAGLKSLTSLDVRGTQVTDAGLRHIAALANLEDLKANSITDAGLAHLTRLKNLKSLILESTRVTDVGLAHLAGLEKLEWLYLYESKVTDAGLAHLTGLERLESLDLHESKVTGPGMTHLKNLKRLTSLSLDGANITDAGLAHVVRLEKLARLCLIDTQITDAGLVHLARLKSLTWLDLPARVTAAGIAKLQQELPNCTIDSQRR